MHPFASSGWSSSLLSGSETISLICESTLSGLLRRPTAINRRRSLRTGESFPGRIQLAPCFMPGASGALSANLGETGNE